MSIGYNKIKILIFYKKVLNLTLHIFPTARNIREYYTQFSDIFLPKCITMGEFEKRAVIVKHKTMIDEDKRVLVLKKAASFENFSKLKLPQDYLSFLKSSKFIFNFFDELALERVDIAHINRADTYAEYEAHLKILEQLLKNYKILLEKEGYFDKVTLPELYEINQEYLKNFSKIILHLDGYLNSYEIELLKKVKNVVNLEIKYSTNAFTKKMIERFKEFGFELEEDKNYRLDITNGKILEVSESQKEIKEVEFCTVSDRVTQIAYIKKKIHDFLNEGILAQNIVVITPDEEFVSLIERFDDNNIFNFAAGYSFKKSSIYRRVDAFYRYLEERSYENRYRLKRYFDDCDRFEKYFGKRFQEIDFDSLMGEFILEDDDKEEIGIYENELYRFKIFKEELKNSSLKDALYLFLSKLKEKRIDDKSGGKITVMGLLESRLSLYDGVIVVDFNENIVPKKESSDIFLNGIVRKHSNLPTLIDRENLQKNYYFKLFINAKKIAISAISNEMQKPSRFLEELPIKRVKEGRVKEEFLKKILLKDSSFAINRFDKDLEMSFDFKKFIFSATSLKIFLECKRRFYYQYIQKIKEAQIPSDTVDEKMAGQMVHLSLKRLYQQHKTFIDKKQMRDKLSVILDELKTKDMEFWVDIWREKLEKFIDNEFERFERGYSFFASELPLKGEIEGFGITGVVDRIDKKEDKFVLLDYKTGKIDITTPKTLDNTTNFQMEFYHILATQNGYKDIDEVGFYDLGDGRIVFENLLDEKLMLLREKFREFNEKRYNFSMNEHLKACRYCPYTKLCGRDEV